MEWIKAAVEAAVTGLFQGIADSWGDALWKWFAELFFVPTAVIADPNVLRINGLLVLVAGALMPLIIVVMVLRFQLDSAVGDNQVAPEILIKRCVLAGLAVMGTPAIAWAGGLMANEMIVAIGALGVDLNLLKVYFKVPGIPGLGVLLLALGFLVGAAVLLVQRFIMTAEFTLLMAVGPIMGLSLLRNEQGGAFQTWFREVCSLLLTPVLQLLLTWFFVRTFADAGLLNPTSFFMSFGFLFVLFRMPRWARLWMYSAGGGDAMVSGGQSVARFAMMRYMFRSLGK